MKNTPSTARRRRRRLPAWLLYPVLGIVLGVLILVGRPALSVLTGGSLFGIQFADPPLGGRTAFNVLVMGLDQPNRLNPKLPRRADSIILAHVDLTTKMVSGVSIPRDTRTRLGDPPVWRKINAAYDEGPRGVMRIVHDITGVPVDYFVVLDTASTKSLVDRVGGVQVTVDKRMKYDDTWQNLHIDLQPGTQWLNGDQAVGFVRFRHDATGDIARMRRQQQFIRAMAGRVVAPANLPKLPGIIAEMRNQVTTNMDDTDLVYLARQMRSIPSSHLEFQTLTGENRKIGGADYFIPYGGRMRQSILSAFPGTVVPESERVDTIE